MTQPPDGWSAPGGSPPPGAPPPPGQQGYYAPPPPPPPNPWYVAPPPPPGVVPLRPLGLGEILDGAIKVIRRYPRPSLGLSAVITLVVTVVNVALIVSVPTTHLDPGEAGSSGFQISLAAQSLSNRGVAAVLGFLGSLVLTGALITVVGNAVQGKAVTTAQVWAAVRPRLLALLGLSLLTGLLTAAPAVVGILIAVILGVATGGPGLLLGIPLAIAGFVSSIYLYNRLSLASAALILEKVSVGTALRRSGVLVRGSWWRVFGILSLTGLISAVLLAILGLPIAVIAAVATGGDTQSTAYRVAASIGGGLASVLVSPFASGVRALLYVDRRMRAEGLDVALQAATGTGPGR